MNHTYIIQYAPNPLTQFDKHINTIFPQSKTLTEAIHISRLTAICLKYPLNVVIVAHSSNAIDIPQHIPCVIYRSTPASDELKVHRLIYNTAWIDTVDSIHDIIVSFIERLPTRILSFPIVASNPSIFWQYPVITERFCLERIAAISNIPFIYVGIPFATLIDRDVLPTPELIQLHKQIQTLKLANPTLRIITACQHIHYIKIMPIVKMLGFTDIYLAHKLKGQSQYESIILHGLPLYPVNALDTSRSIGIQYDTLKSINRQYLFSFIGAHMRHYLNPIRKRILEWPPSKDNTYIIRDTKIWHFEKAVYQHQVRGYELTPADITHQDAQTHEYNRIITQSIFSLCPVGAGPNTIRLWESICLGSIPVIIADEFSIEDFVPSHFGTDWYIELPYKSQHLISPGHLETYLKGISQDRINMMKMKCFDVAEHIKQAFVTV